MGVGAELSDCLGDEDVEPVEGFGGVRVDVVVRLAEHAGGCKAGRRAEDVGGGAFGPELAGGVAGGGVEGERAAVAMVGRGRSFRSIEGAGCAAFCGRWRVTEDEELDKGADEKDYRELAEYEALGEGETDVTINNVQYNVFLLGMAHDDCGKTCGGASMTN